jgi:exodeoxyribonuclease III
VSDVRIVAWNILQGAAKRSKAVAEALLAHAPDIVVLTEYHPNRSSVIADRLAADGLHHQAAAPAGYGFEVFIAARTTVTPGVALQVTSAVVGGYLEVELPAYRIAVGGVYAPVLSAVSMREKRGFWHMLHDAGRRRIHDAFVLIGDMNTGDYPMDKENPGKPFSCTPEYRQMKEIGLVEAWREMNGARLEYSWRSRRGAGFRIDHAFLTPPARQRLLSARYSHLEREARLSDHSVFVIDIAELES